MKHIEICSNHDAVKVRMPVNEDGSPQHVEFKNVQKQMRHPFTIYVDMECFPEKIDTCSPNPNKSYTKKYQKHKVSGYSILIKCFDGKLYPQKLIQYAAKLPDEDVSQTFDDTLEAYIKDLCQKVQSKYTKPNKSKRKDCNKFEYATKCHICNGELGHDKVWDHYHYTGKYRGAAHAKCNLPFQNPKFIHNLSCTSIYQESWCD